MAERVAREQMVCQRIACGKSVPSGVSAIIITIVTTDDREKIHCNSCRNETWHRREARYTKEIPIHTFEGGEVVSELVDLAEIWACLGCDSATFRHRHVAEDELTHEAFYPQRGRDLVPKQRFLILPANLARIYDEIITTINGNSFILCAAGLRALLEGICNDKQITGKTLSAKIDGLDMLVAPTIVKNLHGFRFLGNRALHRLKPPTREDLVLAVEVIEDVMNAIYELDYKSGRLMQRLQPAAPAMAKTSPAKVRPNK